MAEIVRNPPQVVPEGVVKRWASERATETIAIDRGKLLQAEDPTPLFPKR
jgi:hypothetical protein